MSTNLAARSPLAVAAAELPAVSKALETAWSGTSGQAAHGAMQIAAGAVTQLATDDGTLQSALSDGIAKVNAAATEVYLIADAACKAGSLAVSSALAAGPAGWLTAAGQVQALVAQANTNIQARLNQLATELSGPTQTLLQLAAAQSDEVNNAGLEAAAAPAVGGDNDAGTAPATMPSDAGAGAPTLQAQQAVQKALSAVGTPYVWGGNTPGSGLDCSGLTKWAYGEAGVDLPRTANAQTVGRQVSADSLLPGDLLVWDGHVAMYTGNGQIVEAGDPVQTGALRTENMGMTFLGYWRPTG